MHAGPRRLAPSLKFSGKCIQKVWSLQQKADFQGRESFILSGISNIFWYLHLHSVQQQWGNRASVSKMHAGRNYRDFDIFCHLLCCPPHIPLFAHKGDVAASSCIKLIWPTLLPSHSDWSQSQLTRPWERNYTTFIKPDIFPSKPGGGTGIVFYFCCWASEARLCSSISHGISCHECFWKEEATIPTRQLNILSQNALGCPNLSFEHSSENVLYSREVWMVPAYFHWDWQSHKRSLCEGRDVCWGKEWQAYFHA